MTKSMNGAVHRALAAVIAVGLLSSPAIAANDLEVMAGIPDGQVEVIGAQQRGQGLNYVEVKQVEVVKVLPDDLHGRRHQKWLVRLANGRNVLAVNNIAISQRVPVQPGDVISLGGQYIWDKGGGLIHWLHEDPNARRPDGYVEHNGDFYGDVAN